MNSLDTSQLIDVLKQIAATLASIDAKLAAKADKKPENQKLPHKPRFRANQQNGDAAP